jgi:hypothetical protein
MAGRWPQIVALGIVAMVAACSKSESPAGPTPPPNPGNPTLTAPTPDTPATGAQLETLRPTLTVRNGTSSVAGARVYEFQISDRSDFSANVTAQSAVAEGPATTSFTPSSDLLASTRMFWRARFTQGSASSDWSPTAQFRTRFVGFNRMGELYDPLVHSETIGSSVGSTAFLGSRGLRVDNATSWVRYQLSGTLTSGEISVEVEGLHPNGPCGKSRIFSMMDGGSNLFDSKFLFNVQYRGSDGNPDNAISYKLLMGDADLKYEPDFGQRSAGIRSLDPNTTYLWTATWGSTFRLTASTTRRRTPSTLARTTREMNADRGRARSIATSGLAAGLVRRHWLREIGK